MKQNNNPESIDAQANRLRITRIALMNGVDNQAEFCRRSGIPKTAWNNAETGDNYLTITNILKICRVWGLSTDWILRGDKRLLHGDLLKRIADVENPGKTPAKGALSRPQTSV